MHRKDDTGWQQELVEPAAPDARIGAGQAMDRFELYERCVQSPGELVPFLDALHGGSPRVLREDFCGTAAVARAWAARSDGHSAEAVDHDAEPLARAGATERVERVRCDVRIAPIHVASADIVFVGNYSIGELGTRAELVAYLCDTQRRLRRGGVFVCDTYGGESAFRVGRLERRHVGPEGTILHHVWEQRVVDPLTARVENALHFRIEREGEILEQFREAFVYRWRLWSVAELIDAAREAEFGATAVHTEVGSGAPTARGVADLAQGFSAVVAARRA